MCILNYLTPYTVRLDNEVTANSKGGSAVSSVTVNIRMEQSLKRDLARFCAEIGLSMNTLFNIYVRMVVRAQRIPFALGHPAVLKRLTYAIAAQ